MNATVARLSSRAEHAHRASRSRCARRDTIGRGLAVALGGRRADGVHAQPLTRPTPHTAQSPQITVRTVSLTPCDRTDVSDTTAAAVDTAAAMNTQLSVIIIGLSQRYQRLELDCFIGQGMRPHAAHIGRRGQWTGTRASSSLLSVYEMTSITESLDVRSVRSMSLSLPMSVASLSASNAQRRGIGVPNLLWCFSRLYSTLDMRAGGVTKEQSYVPPGRPFSMCA
mmetsp:Transcript_22063/g.54271  ORF Transcript_22063/g.54271 Transcript_22063/m.54271 type:complete len:225 (-) Transcript_22063:461-1135(-)